MSENTAEQEMHQITKLLLASNELRRMGLQFANTPEINYEKARNQVKQVVESNKDVANKIVCALFLSSEKNKRPLAEAKKISLNLMKESIPIVKKLIRTEVKYCGEKNNIAANNILKNVLEPMQEIRESFKVKKTMKA